MKRKAPPRSPSREIVIIDEAPIRRQLLRQHHDLEAKAAALRERLDHFETSEVPAFTRWEAQTLGPRLTAIRDTEAEINRQRMIWAAIEDEQYFTGCTPRTAYRRVMDALNGPPPPEPEPDPEPAPRAEESFFDAELPPGFEADDFDLLPPARQREFREQYAHMAAMYEAATGKIAPDLDDLLRTSRRKKNRRREPRPEAPPRPEPKRPASRVKELYRKLVRQLHPDLNPGQDARAAELWHTVQAAYERQDLEALEAAAARADLFSGDAEKLPFFLLRRVLAELRQALGALKGKLTQARQHPAWDFHARASELKRYEAEQRRQLERHHTAQVAYLATLQAQLEALAPAPRKSPRRSPKKRRTQQQEFTGF